MIVYFGLCISSWILVGNYVDDFDWLGVVVLDGWWYLVVVDVSLC